MIAGPITEDTEWPSWPCSRFGAKAPVTGKTGFLMSSTTSGWRFDTLDEFFSEFQHSAVMIDFYNYACVTFENQSDAIC